MIMNKTSKDIFDHKKSDHAAFLESRLQETRVIFDQLDEIVIELVDTEQQQVVYWSNRKAAEVFDITIEDDITKIIPEATWRPFFQQLKESSGSYRQQMSAGGHSFLLTGLYSSVMNTQTIKLILTDITEITSLNETLSKKIGEIREEALDSDERFYETFEQDAIGIAHIGLDYKIIRANGKLCRMLSHPKDALVGAGIFDLTIESDNKKNREQIERLLQDPKNSSFTLEKRCHTKDGGQIWVNVTTSLSHHREQPMYFICFVTDVTEKVLLQKELEKNEERFEVLYEDAPLSYQSLDESGNIIQINRTWLDTLGYAKEAVVGHNFMEFVVPEEQKLLQERFGGFLQNSFVHDADFTLLKEDGNKVVVSVEGRTVRDRYDGQIVTHCILEDITSERKAKEALLISEQKLRQVIDAANLGVWDWEYQSGVHHVDDTWLNMLGYVKGDLKKDVTDWSDHIHPDDKEQVEQTIAEAIKANISYTVEFRMHHLDGHWVWIQGSGAVVEHDENGSPLRLVGTHQDISQRKREEDRETLFNSVVQYSNDAIYLADVDSGHVIDANTRATEMMGYTREQLIGMHVSVISEEMEDMETWRKHNEKIRVNKKHLIVTRYRRADGGLIDVEVSVSLVVLDDSLYSLAIVRDITERLEAEVRQQMLAEIIDQSTNEFYLLDRQTMDFRYVNRAAAQQLGYDYDELLTMAPKDLSSEFTVDALTEVAKPLFNKDKKQLVFEAMHRRKDGSTYPIEVRLQLVNTVEGESLLAVIMNITERKMAENKAKEQEELLFIQSRHAAMGEMISMIAHQWRQPLSVISMMANNLLIDLELDSLDSVLVKETALKTVKQTQYLSRTIDDFREFFRPSRPKYSFDVADTLEESLKMMENTLSNSGVIINKAFSDAYIIESFASELLQVFLVLFNNAIDAFMDKDNRQKEVTISISSSESGVTIDLCDNAGGIDKHIIDKVFEPYFSTKDNKNGTGVGLYMSKLIVEKHMKGKILVKNHDDGVCFTLLLPFDF